ncbi:leucine-rich repeat domain-containing protein [Akkermansiaceae bacterium]|nr:leucine-rich repeat domain-containing protein [Akkermansiaceae bacterium]
MPDSEECCHPGGRHQHRGGAFSSCVSLISVTIPGGVTSVKKSTFENCTMLKSVNIPEGVTSIGKKAFRSSGLEQFIIPEGVTRID